MSAEHNTFTIPALAALTQRDRRWIERRLSGVPHETQGKAHVYKLENALPALCKESAEMEAMQRQVITDKQREQKAMADLREMQAEKMAGNIVEKHAYQFSLQDYVALASAKLSQEPWPEEIRDKVFEIMRESFAASFDETDWRVRCPACKAMFEPRDGREDAEGNPVHQEPDLLPRTKVADEDFAVQKA